MNKAYNREPTEKYFCRICETEHGVKGFPSHLKRHNVKFLDYIKENIADFEPHWKICPVCNENPTSKLSCSKKCGYILRDINNEPRNIWAEMSPETKIAAKKKISEKASVNQIGRNIWAEMDEETSRNAKNAIAEKTSIRCNGEGNPMFGKTHTPEAIQKIFKFRNINKLEKKVQDFLIENNIDHTFQFFINGSTRHSFDFRINETNLIIETDGDFWHGNPATTNHYIHADERRNTDQLKENIAKEFGYDVIRFWESEIHQNFESVKNKILTEIEIRKNKICQN